MKFFFYKSGNQQLGSNRIYINNLSSYLIDIDQECIVSEDIKNCIESDICILNKFTNLSEIQKVKKLNPKCKIGLVHPSDLQRNFKNKIKYIDFLITGSIEERDHYLEYCKNIFRFPQIEKIQPILPNHNNNKEIFKIGYHGNLEHLNEMQKNVSKALEDISKKYNLEFIAVYDMKLGKWTKGRPNIKITEINWTFENMINEMSKIDIGIVPCTNNYLFDKHYNDSNFFVNFFKKIYGRTNDYNIQFKVTSNSGRAFVFHQLGIPVIADFWPSNFEILDNKSNGFLAHSRNGWYNALEKLITSPKQRNDFAQNAQKRFLTNYNPIDWAKLFLNFLKDL